MANRRTEWTNAWESALAAEFAAGATTITVADASALNVPCYVVIEPEVTAQREYVYVSEKNTDVLTVTERNLAGSAGDVDHPNGAVIRTVALAQGFTDLHDRIDAGDSALANHEAAPDPHTVYLPVTGARSMAGALDMGGNSITNADIDGSQLSGTVDVALLDGVVDEANLPSLDYLPLAGGTLTGFLTLHSAPTADLHASTKKYVDDQVGAISTHWDDISGKPSTFTPSSHNHDAGDITSGTLSISRIPSSTSVTSTSTSTVATSSAVKTAYDKGNHSHPYASSSHTHNYASSSHTHSTYLAKTGGTMTGQLTTNGNIEMNGAIYMDNQRWEWRNIYWVNNSAYGSLRPYGTGSSHRIYAHSSSRKIKSNFAPLEGSWDKVKRLAGAAFTYDSPSPSPDDPEKTVQKRNIGFVAEDVYEVEPLTTVEPDADGYVLTMSEDGIVAHLTVALAEALDRIEQLETALA